MSDQDRSQELLLLGKIHGIVEGLRDGQAALEKKQAEGFKAVSDRIDGVDDRLRVVEQKAAVSGAVSGAATSVGVALIVEALRAWVRGTGGPHIP